MMDRSFQIKLQACNLCDAMHRNINDNFQSVSFRIESNDEISVKIVLSNMTDEEEEYIDDIISEFESRQENNNVKKVVLTKDKASLPYENIVYQKDNT
jgi:hypothetical protein